MKSQISTEFMAMIMMATLMIIIFMIMFSELYQDNLTDKKGIIMRDFAYSIQTEFVLAAESREGYTRTFEVPVKLEGFDYEINVVNDSYMKLNYTDNLILLAIPSAQGDFIKGMNTIKTKNNSICLNC